MAVFLSDEQQVAADGEDLVAVARHVLSARKVPDDMEVAILLVDEATIAGLNKQHMDKDGPTDVLAFPIDEPGQSPPDVPSILGDVVVCPAVAAGQAAEAGREPQEELQVLVTHGLLHLLGMDHDDPAREQEMFGLTEDLLRDYRAALR